MCFISEDTGPAHYIIVGTQARFRCRYGTARNSAPYYDVVYTMTWAMEGDCMSDI